MASSDESDDDKWLKALARGAPPDTSPEEAREVAALRKAIVGSEADGERKVERGIREEAQAMQSLLSRLRSERLLERPRRKFVPVAIAASLLLVALLLGPQWLRDDAPVYDQPPRPRGVIETRDVISGQPRADAEYTLSLHDALPIYRKSVV